MKYNNQPIFLIIGVKHKIFDYQSLTSYKLKRIYDLPNLLDRLLFSIFLDIVFYEMKSNHFKLSFLIIVLSILYGCSSLNSTLDSFNKRKYNNGIFTDNPSKISSNYNGASQYQEKQHIGVSFKAVKVNTELNNSDLKTVKESILKTQTVSKKTYTSCIDKPKIILITTVLAPPLQNALQKLSDNPDDFSKKTTYFGLAGLISSVLSIILFFVVASQPALVDGLGSINGILLLILYLASLILNIIGSVVKTENSKWYSAVGLGLDIGVPLILLLILLVVFIFFL